jgi:hypothetical protein
MAKAKAKVKRAKSLTNVKSWGKRREDEVRHDPVWSTQLKTGQGYLNHRCLRFWHRTVTWQE